MNYVTGIRGFFDGFRSRLLVVFCRYWAFPMVIIKSKQFTSFS